MAAPGRCPAALAIEAGRGAEAGSFSYRGPFVSKTMKRSDSVQ